MAQVLQISSKILHRHTKLELYSTMQTYEVLSHTIDNFTQLVNTQRQISNGLSNRNNSQRVAGVKLLAPASPTNPMALESWRLFDLAMKQLQCLRATWKITGRIRLCICVDSDTHVTQMMDSLNRIQDMARQGQSMALQKDDMFVALQNHKCELVGVFTPKDGHSVLAASENAPAYIMHAAICLVTLPGIQDSSLELKIDKDRVNSIASNLNSLYVFGQADHTLECAEPLHNNIRLQSIQHRNPDVVSIPDWAGVGVLAGAAVEGVPLAFGTHILTATAGAALGCTIPVWGGFALLGGGGLCLASACAIYNRPSLCAEDDDNNFDQFPGYDCFPGDNDPTAQTMRVDSLAERKRICRDKGCGAFVIWGERVSFRSQTAEACYLNMERNNASIFLVHPLHKEAALKRPYHFSGAC